MGHAAARVGDAVTSLAQATCAVVVTYNPEPGLAARLGRVVPQVNHLIVVDNASRTSPARDLEAFGEKVTLIVNGDNVGIGEALNIGVRAAKARGASWVLMLDDDSLVDAHLVERYGELLAQAADADKVALLGCNFWDLNRGVLGLEPLVFRHRLGPSPFVMSSGSLLRVSAFDKVGPMRGDFFIDCIDFEYGLRMEAAGYLCLLTCEVLMDHTLGRPAWHRFPPKQCSHNSIARKYYWVRNRAVMLREYKDTLPHRLPLVRGKPWAQVLHVLLHERNKVARLRAIRLALRHAREGRLGKAPESLQRLAAGER